MAYCAPLCAHGLPCGLLLRVVSSLRCNGGLWVRCVRRTTLRDAALRRNVACAAAFDIPYRRAAGRGGVSATDAADADDSAQDEGPSQQGTPKWESPKWEGNKWEGTKWEGPPQQGTPATHTAQHADAATPCLMAPPMSTVKNLAAQHALSRSALPVLLA